MTAKEMFENLGYFEFNIKYADGEWWQVQLDEIRRKNIKIYTEDKEVCVYEDLSPKWTNIRSGEFPTVLDVAYPAKLDKDELMTLFVRLKELGWLDE